MTLSLVAMSIYCLAQQDSAPPDLQAARSALDAGRTESAIRQAQDYTTRHPYDMHGFVTLGDAYSARRRAGLFLAREAYAEARRLAPDDPEPPYRMARVGIALGGDDGAAIAGEALERTMDLDPLYRDAWDLWSRLYRNPERRRHMADLLWRHLNNSAVLPRLAQLRIEDEAYAEANELLDSALRRDPDNGSLLALRAQSALEDGDTLTGITLYNRALARAGSDTANVLWRQAVGIATPDEIRSWTHIPLSRRGAWLQSFWARRNPNLFAGFNHRVSEHFVRWRYAREHYPLQHPLAILQRDTIGRALEFEPSAGEREFYTRCEATQLQMPTTSGSIQPAGAYRDVDRPLGGLWWMDESEKALVQWQMRHDPSYVPKSIRDAVWADAFAFAPTIWRPLGFDLRNIDSTAARLGYNLATGLDDRGIMYLRFGAPAEDAFGGVNPGDRRCNSVDLERWRYSNGTEVRFSRPSAFSRGERTTGEMIFRAMNERQFEGMQLGLTSDATSEPAILSFGVWTAQFRQTRDTTRSELLVVSTKGELAAQLIGEAGGAADSGLGEPAVMLSARPGSYRLLAQGRSNDSLGRRSANVLLRSFYLGGVSDVLLSGAWEGPVSRAEMIQRLSRSLDFTAGDTVRTYLELYGLYADRGVISYKATYSILRTNHAESDIRLEHWPGVATIEVSRIRPATAGTAEVESIDILPDRIPAGTYLLRVDIAVDGGVRFGRATTSFHVR